VARRIVQKLSRPPRDIGAVHTLPLSNNRHVPWGGGSGTLRQQLQAHTQSLDPAMCQSTQPPQAHQLSAACPHCAIMAVRPCAIRPILRSAATNLPHSPPPIQTYTVRGTYADKYIHIGYQTTQYGWCTPTAHNIVVRPTWYSSSICRRTE
jgi:hypothetical protein